MASRRSARPKVYGTHKQYTDGVNQNKGWDSSKRDKEKKTQTKRWNRTTAISHLRALATLAIVGLSLLVRETSDCTSLGTVRGPNIPPAQPAGRRPQEQARSGSHTTACGTRVVRQSSPPGSSGVRGYREPEWLIEKELTEAVNQKGREGS